MFVLVLEIVFFVCGLKITFELDFNMMFLICMFMF